MKYRPDEFKISFVLVIALIVGVSNGIIVNINKPILGETIILLPIAGGVVYSIITGEIKRIFEDVIEAIVGFMFLSLVFILGLSIIPMIITGLLIRFLKLA